MNRPLLILFSALLLLNPVFSPPVTHAATYVPGVQAGQFVNLGQLSETSNGTLPKGFNILANFSSINELVQSVVGNDVTALVTVTFTNGTAPRSMVEQGNVQTGTGNLTFLIVSGGLSAGDPVYQSTQSSFQATVNETVTRAYAGQLRSVNVFNETIPFSRISVQFYWDATTGFLLELSETGLVPIQSSHSVMFSVDAKATSTNVWSSSSLPDFGFYASTATANKASPGGSLTYTLNLTSFQGFSGPVSLTRSLTNSSLLNAPTLTLAAPSVNIPLNGFATTTLTFSTSTSTPPGLYLFSVHSASTSSSHDDLFAAYVQQAASTVGTVVATIPVGNTPYGLLYDNANGYMYVANGGTNTLSVISGTTVAATIPVGTTPHDLAYDSKNGDIYAPNVASGTVSVINGTTNTVVDTINVGTSPFGVAYNDRNGYIYVVHHTPAGYVTVINATTNAVVTTVSVGSYPIGAGYDTKNGYVYITNYGSNTVSVINGTKVVATVPVGGVPYGVAYDSGNGYIYIVNYSTNNVSVINGTTYVATVPVGKGPYTLGYDSQNGYVYVANNSSNSTSVISGTTVVGTIPVGHFPYGAAYDDGNGYVYVSNAGSNTVSVISTAIVAPFDYSLSNSGPVTVQSGSSGVAAITATLTAGAASPVALSCVSSSLPSGITCGTFTLNPVTPTSTGASSALTINVASSVATGSYSVRVSGSPLGATTSATNVNVIVTPPPTFSRVGSLTMGSGVNNLYSAVIDTTNGYAYFVAQTSPGIIVKLRLSDFTIVGTLTLNTGENLPTSAVIDTANGYAYLGTHTSPGIVVKIRLSDLTRVGSLTLNTGEDYLDVATIDTSNGYAYFATHTVPGIIVKISLSTFTRVGALTLTAGENYSESATIDQANGFAYIATSSASGSPAIVKVKLSDFSNTGALVLTTLHNGLQSAVLDSTTGYAYFGTYSSPAIIAKIRLSDFTSVGFLTLTGVGNLDSAVIDSAGGYAYFGTGNSPGIVVRLRLSAFNTMSLTVNTGENSLYSAVIDPAHGFAYFGTLTSPGIIVKVAIAGPSPPPAFDYSLSNSGGINVQQGGSSTNTITSTLKAGTTQSVTLSCVPFTLPTGASCSFNPQSLTPLVAGTTSVLTIHTTSATPLGTYNVQVTSSPLGATTSPTAFVLTVNSPPPPPFDYSLSVNPSITSLIAGSSTSATITATLTSGTAQPVILQDSVSPTVAVCLPSAGTGISPCGALVFSPSILTPSGTGATSTMTITTTTVLPPGTYTLTITGYPAGASSSQAKFTFTVAAPSTSNISCGRDLLCSVVSNSTLSNIKFAGNTIHIEADGPHGAHGYANVTVPKTAIPHLDTIHVFVDNGKLDSSTVTITSNSTDYFIYFTYTYHSPVKIDIQLTAPEPAPNAPTILGIDPTLFYEILGAGIAVIIIVSAALVVRRRGRTRPTI